MQGCGDAAEVKDVSANPRSDVARGPVELVFDPVADDREDAEDGSVAIEKF